MQVFLQAVNDLMSGDNTAPPDRTIDGNSTTPVNPKREQERRFAGYDLVPDKPDWATAPGDIATSERVYVVGGFC